jgi:hypothetical protein
MQKIKINGINHYLVAPGIVYNPKRAELKTLNKWEAEKLGVETITELEYKKLYKIGAAREANKKEIENRHPSIRFEYQPVNSEILENGCKYGTDSNKEYYKFWRNKIQEFTNNPNFNKIFGKTSIRAIF